MDFPIVLAPDSVLPLFQQLTLELRQSILSGRVRPGQHLPSAKELAEALALSRSTVVKAYRQLHDEGVLETRVGSGTFVRGSLDIARPNNRSDEARAETPVRHLSNLSRAMLDVEISVGASDAMADLNFASGPADLLPFRQWSELFNRNCRNLHMRKHGSDQEVFGYRPLREALTAYLRRSKAVDCRTEQVIVFTSSQNAIHYVSSLLVSENDLVIVENPGYAGTRNNLKAAGARLEAIDVDENGLKVDDLERIERSCKLACVSLSHHDPSGAILSLNRRKQLIAWAERANAFILEDAWDSDYHYGAPALPALQGLDRNDRVLYSYSFWKLLFPIVTIGVLVVPEQLIKVFTRAKLLIDRQAAPIEQYALTDFINHGHLETHINRSRAVYESRRQVLIFNLKQCFRDLVEIPKYTAGLHQLIRLRIRLEESFVLDCARLAKLPMVSTKSYYVRDPVELEFLVPFGSLDNEGIRRKVAEFAARLERALVK